MGTVDAIANTFLIAVCFQYCGNCLGEAFFIVHKTRSIKLQFSKFAMEDRTLMEPY